VRDSDLAGAEEAEGSVILIFLMTAPLVSMLVAREVVGRGGPRLCGGLASPLKEGSCLRRLCCGLVGVDDGGGLGAMEGGADDGALPRKDFIWKVERCGGCWLEGMNGCCLGPLKDSGGPRWPLAGVDLGERVLGVPPNAAGIEALKDGVALRVTFVLKGLLGVACREPEGSSVSYLSFVRWSAGLSRDADEGSLILALNLPLLVGGSDMPLGRGSDPRGSLGVRPKIGPPGVDLLE
jgi:hypothetical protein